METLFEGLFEGGLEGLVEGEGFLFAGDEVLDLDSGGCEFVGSEDKGPFGLGSRGFPEGSFGFSGDGFEMDPAPDLSTLLSQEESRRKSFLVEADDEIVGGRKQLGFGGEKLGGIHAQKKPLKSNGHTHTGNGGSAEFLHKSVVASAAENRGLGSNVPLNDFEDGSVIVIEASYKVGILFVGDFQSVEGVTDPLVVLAGGGAEAGGDAGEFFQVGMGERVFGIEDTHGVELGEPLPVVNPGGWFGVLVGGVLGSFENAFAELGVVLKAVVAVTKGVDFYGQLLESQVAQQVPA